MQVGVCLFSDDGDGGYHARPYNFFVFPAVGDDVAMSASAISFLKKHGMDWNKWCAALRSLAWRAARSPPHSRGEGSS